MQIFSDNENLQYSGRIDFDNPKEPVFVYAASYVKMNFTGSTLKVRISNQKQYWTNYVGYILDGEQGKITLSDEPGEKLYVIAENMKKEKHELMLFKRMDSCHIFTLHGFEVEEDATLFPVEEKPNRSIEVFGDSVSCGEVSEAVEYVGKEDP